MSELLLAEFAEALNWALPQTSSPARFARMLAESIPSWRVEPPDKDAADVHFAAIAPDASGCSVAVTADWPIADGYRDIDEWTVTGYGCHRVAVEMQLCHDADQAEFQTVLRLLRATWTASHEHPSGSSEGTIGREDVMDDVFSTAKWFKSTDSGAAGHCVEAAFLENNGVGVRNSRDPEGPKLEFTGPEWVAFIAGAKAGEFDPR